VKCFVVPETGCVSREEGTRGQKLGWGLVPMGEEPVFLRSDTTKLCTPHDLLLACSHAYDGAHLTCNTSDSLSREQLRLIIKAQDLKIKCLERMVEELRSAFDREFKIKLARVLPVATTSKLSPAKGVQALPARRLSHKPGREERKEEEGDDNDNDDDGSDPESPGWFDILGSLG
jgi:hypothetical protein